MIGYKYIFWLFLITVLCMILLEVKQIIEEWKKNKIEVIFKYFISYIMIISMILLFGYAMYHL